MIFKYNKDLLWCVAEVKALLSQILYLTCLPGQSLDYYFSAVKFYMLMLTYNITVIVMLNKNAVIILFYFNISN